MGRNLLQGTDRAAARAADGAWLISALEQGYGHAVGEGGARLRQDRSIDRCSRRLAGYPRVLYLDEADVTFDSDTSGKSRRPLSLCCMKDNGHCGSQHRLSPIRGADRILWVLITAVASRHAERDDGDSTAAL